MEAAASEKIPEIDDAGDWLPLEDEEDYDGTSAGIEEGMLEEVMRRLEEEISGPDSLLPYSSSAFITINGNEESCGPSFSDSASTVMASIDMGGAGVGIWGLVGFTDLCCEGQGQDLQPMEEEQWVGIKEASGDAGSEESDEEWLARILNAPAFEFEL